MTKGWNGGEEVNREHPLVTGLHWSRRPVPPRQRSFPFKRAKVVYTQGGGGRNGLPASRHPPPGRVRGRRSPHSTVNCRETDRHLPGNRSGGRWGPETARKPDSKLGERSDLGAGGRSRERGRRAPAPAPARRARRPRKPERRPPIRGEARGEAGWAGGCQPRPPR